MRRSFMILLPLLAVLLAPTGAWEASVSQNLSITVTPAAQSVSFNPTTLTFPSQGIDTPSAPQSVTMTNSGNVSFPLSGVAITGADAGDFSETNNCPSSLAVSATCQISVTFTPTATGTRTASVVVSATGGGTYTVSLNGTGVSAFFVATNGSDSNAGTLAAPFATLGRCQSAMQASSTIKTCYIRAGTYTLAPSASDPCSLGSNGPASINLGSADSGETWSYYPPDGLRSAILDGGSTAAGNGTLAGICVNGNTSAINFVGLHVQRFQNWGIIAEGAVNIYNNEASNMTDNFGINGADDAALQLYCGNIAGSQIYNNYVHDNSDRGITVEPCTGNNTTGISVHNNFLYNNCTGFGDCGALYTTGPGGQTGSYSLTNNYIRDVYTAGGGNVDNGGVCIYFDAQSDGVTAAGNVCTGSFGTCTLYGSATNIHFNQNICNLKTNNTALTFYTNNFNSPTMNGNQFQHNIVVGNSSGAAGAGFRICCTGSYPTNLLSASGNSYFNYGTGGLVNLNCDQDCVKLDNTTSSSVYQNPQLHCWGAILAATSPVFNSPMSFPAQPADWDTPGYWGYSGFTVTQTGNSPTWPTASGDGVTCASGS